MHGIIYLYDVTPKVLAKQLFLSTDCDLHVMPCSPPGVATVAG